MENEIRGCSIYSVELIRKEILRLFQNKEQSNDGQKGKGNVNVNAIEIDFYLWEYAQKHREKMAAWPIHHTYSVFY